MVVDLWKQCFSNFNWKRSTSAEHRRQKYYAFLPAIVDLKIMPGFCQDQCFLEMRTEIDLFVHSCTSTQHLNFEQLHIYLKEINLWINACLPKWLFTVHLVTIFIKLPFHRISSLELYSLVISNIWRQNVQYFLCRWANTVYQIEEFWLICNR